MTTFSEITKALDTATFWSWTSDPRSDRDTLTLYFDDEEQDRRTVREVEIPRQSVRPASVATRVRRGFDRETQAWQDEVPEARRTDPIPTRRGLKALRERIMEYAREVKGIPCPPVFTFSPALHKRPARKPAAQTPNS